MISNKMPVRRLVIASLLTLLLLAGCGGPSSVDVNLTDTAIQATPNTFRAGDITFHIKNTSGSEMHEMVIIQTDLTPDQLPTDADGNIAEDKLPVSPASQRFTALVARRLWQHSHIVRKTSRL